MIPEWEAPQIAGVTGPHQELPEHGVQGIQGDHAVLIHQQDVGPEVPGVVVGRYDPDAGGVVEDHLRLLQVEGAALEVNLAAEQGGFGDQDLLDLVDDLIRLPSGLSGDHHQGARIEDASYDAEDRENKGFANQLCYPAGFLSCGSHGFP